MRWVVLCVFFLGSFLFGEDSYFVLKGYLNEEALSYARQKLHAINDPGGKLIFHVNSSSGDLSACLCFAREIYDVKIQGHRSVTLYIEGKAVGPAAIFPFLADEIIVPPLVAWGDIPYGVKELMTSEQLRSAVTFLAHKNRRASTLYQLANAMIDPHYQMVYQNGHGIIQREESGGFDPLVLNLRGMRSLGLVDGVMDRQTFLEEYSHLSRENMEYLKKISRETFREQFKKYVSYSESKENLVGYLSIKNKRPIDQSTYIYIKFALKDFIKKRVCFVILNLDTPGGEVVSALKIVNLLQKLDVHSHIPVVAFVNDWALSAGAMLAYSCRFIGATPFSLMGAADKAVLKSESKSGLFSKSEKISPAFKTEFASIAAFYERNPLIAEAMVDKQMGLALRNHQIVQFRSESDGVDSLCDRILSKQGEPLFLNGKEMIDLGIADFEIPFDLDSTCTHGKRSVENNEDQESFLIFQDVTLSEIPNVKIIGYRNWKVQFFAILTHPVVATLLLIGLVIGFYVEINTPGIGIPGFVSLGCLALMILSSFASHSIHWIEILIVCFGLFLLILELFVIPGFGIVGVLGILLTIIGVFTLTLPEIDQLNFLDPGTLKWVGPIFWQRVAWLSGGLIFALVVILLMACFFSHRFFPFSKFVLKDAQEKKGTSLTEVLESAKEVMPQPGTFGESVTPLRPSGKAHIGENLFDAVSLTGDIDAHTPVEVVKIEGSKVIVKSLKQ